MENRDNGSRVPVEKLALITLLATLALAILYPETFIAVPPEVAGISVIPLNLLMPVVLMVSSFCILVRRRSLGFTLIDGALLAFFSYLLIRNVVAGIEVTAIIKYSVYGIGVFYLARVAFSDERCRRIFLWSIAAIVGLIVAYGFIESALQENIVFYDSIAEIVPEPQTGFHRAGSTLAHPVVLGALMVQVLPFLILLSTQTKARQRLLALAVTAGAALMLLLTFSKGSWLSAGILVLVALALMLIRRDLKMLRLLWAGLAAIAVATLVFWNQIRAEIGWRTDRSVGHRWRAWRGALEAVQDAPVFGVGFKQGSATLMEMEVGRQYLHFAGRTIAVDNNYLSLLLEAGIVGFCLWILFIAALGLAGIRYLLARGLQPSWVLAGMTGIAGLCVNAVTFEAWLIWPTYLMFMTTAGIITATRVLPSDTG